MSRVWITRECHVDGIRRPVGETVDVAPDVGVRLVQAGYARFDAPIERAVAPPAPERAVAPAAVEPPRRSRRR